MIELAIKRPVAVTMIVIAIIVFGVLSYTRLKLKLMPDITYPSITVRTEYPGAAPEDVEKTVTVKLEERLTTLTHLKSVVSVSRAGVSDVILNFSWKANFDKAVSEVREKVERIFFKDEVGRPLVLRYDPSMDPIIRIAFFPANQEMKFSSLKSLIEDEINPRINVVPGVAAAIIKGGREEEVHIMLDQQKMSRVNVNINDIIRRLKQENVNVAGGTLKTANNQFLIRIRNEFQSLVEIEHLFIKSLNNAPIRLKDIAQIDYRQEEENIVVRVSGKRAVAVEVYKESNANIVKVASNVIKMLKDNQAQFGPYTNYAIMSNQATFVENAIFTLQSTALLGGVLAIIIILFFLGQITTTAIIAVSIPLSIVITFGFMYLFEISLNTMSLGGLALGIGMMVDNSIVVLENIFRHQNMGKSKISAALTGTQEVVTAVIASTLTTIAVFFPIVFLEGLAGQLFKDFAWSVVFSLLSSLLVAILIIPMLCALGRQTISSKGIKDSLDPNEDQQKKKKNYFKFKLHMIFQDLYIVYPRSLIKVLDHKPAFIFSLVVAIFIAIFIFYYSGSELLPEVHQGNLTVQAKFPVGTPLPETLSRIAKIEKNFTQIDELAMFGSITGIDEQEISNLDEGPNTSRLILRLKREVIKSLKNKEIRLINKINQLLKRTTNLQYEITRPALFSFSAPLQIELFAENLLILNRLNDDVMKMLSNLPILKNIKSSLEKGYPEIIISFYQDQLLKYNVRSEDIASNIANLLHGKIATSMSRKSHTYDIVVKQSEYDIKSLNDIKQMPVIQIEGKYIPLSTVASIRPAMGPSEIRHISKRRAVQINAYLASGIDLKQASLIVETHIKDIIKNYSKTGVVSFRIGGEDVERKASEKEMLLAVLLAIFLVYVVMASQFESFIQPFIIMFSIPLAAIGSAILLWLLGINISVMVFIGLIMLAGIVVNNAIVLIDFMNQQRREGKPPRQTVIEAAKVRLRPICMTSLSTILGLLPMALGWGEGAELRSPMAIAVIGGLFSSTILTLYVIPTIYEIIYQKKRGTP